MPWSVGGVLMYLLETLRIVMHRSSAIRRWGTQHLSWEEVKLLGERVPSWPNSTLLRGTAIDSRHLAAVPKMQKSGGEKSAQTFWATIVGAVRSNLCT